MMYATELTFENPLVIFAAIVLCVLVYATAVRSFIAWPYHSLRRLREDIHDVDTLLSSAIEEGRIRAKDLEAPLRDFTNICVKAEDLQKVYKRETRREIIVSAIRQFPHQQLRRVSADVARLRADLIAKGAGGTSVVEPAGKRMVKAISGFLRGDLGRHELSV